MVACNEYLAGHLESKERNRSWLRFLFKAKTLFIVLVVSAEGPGMLMMPQAASDSQFIAILLGIAALVFVIFLVLLAVYYRSGHPPERKPAKLAVLLLTVLLSFVGLSINCLDSDLTSRDYRTVLCWAIWLACWRCL